MAIFTVMTKYSITENGWLLTEAWCTDSALEDLGVENDAWLKFGIRLKDIIGYKAATPDEYDSFEAGMTVIYGTTKDQTVVRIPIDEFITAIVPLL